MQKPERCATHSFLLRPLDVVAVRAPAGGAKYTRVKQGKLHGKAKMQTSLPYHRLAAAHGRALASPCGGGVMPQRGMTERAPARRA